MKRNPLENEYLKLVDESRKKQKKLTEDQYKQIRKLYKDVANDLRIRARHANKGSLTQGWLKDYRKAILGDLKEVNKILEGKIQDNMQQSAENANAIQLDLFDKINMKYGLGMDKTFRRMFSNIPKEALNELITGGFYKDGRGLSRRIWFNGSKVNGDIDYIIQKGIAEKKSAYELAQDLQSYVNPEVKKDWNWKKVYPNTAKTIDYCAQRLARTSISHSYTLSMLKSCERNPFTTKVKWHSVFALGRTCPLCKSRDGRVYLLKECPIDHPNGMCYQEPILDDSLENIGSRLKDWVNGDSDSLLDDWYSKYGDYFSGMKQKSEEISLGKVEQAKKRDKKINITDVAINKVPCIEIPGFTKEQNLVLQQKHQELLQISKDKNNSNEVLNILSNELDKDVITLGSEAGVNPSKNPEAVALMRRSQANGVIWIHNHPKTSTFSYGDIGSFLLQDQIKAITIVTNTGEIHALSKLDNFDFDGIYDIIESIKEKYGGITKDTSDAIAKEILKHMNEFGIKVTYRGGKNGK